MRQQIEKIGLIDDKVYDWMLIEPEDALEDPRCTLLVIEQEKELLKRLGENVKKIELAEKEKDKEQKSSQLSPIKSPRSKEKECTIF